MRVRMAMEMGVRMVMVMRVMTRRWRVCINVTEIHDIYFEIIIFVEKQVLKYGEGGGEGESQLGPKSRIWLLLWLMIKHTYLIQIPWFFHVLLQDITALNSLSESDTERGDIHLASRARWSSCWWRWWSWWSWRWSSGWSWWTQCLWRSCSSWWISINFWWWRWKSILSRLEWRMKSRTSHKPIPYSVVTSQLIRSRTWGCNTFATTFQFLSHCC